MPPDKQGQQDTDKLSSRELIAVQLAMDAGAAEATLQNEQGAEVALPIVEAIFYATASYPEQCELFDLYIETQTAAGKSMADILTEVFPSTGELPPGASNGGIKAYIAIMAMQKALSKKAAEGRLVITNIVNKIYHSERTLLIKSLLRRDPVEKPMSTGIFRTEGLTDSEKYGLVTMYVNFQSGEGRTPREISQEVGIALDIDDPNSDDFIQLAVRKFDFATRCEARAKKEQEVETKALGPNTLRGKLRKLLDQRKTHVDSDELAVFIDRYGTREFLNDHHPVHLLEAILSEEFLREAGEETVREFAEECLEVNGKEGRRALLDIIFRFDPQDDDPHAPSSILNRIASELRGEEVQTDDLQVEELPPDDERLPTRIRSRIRFTLAAAALIALGGIITNIDRIKTFFQDTEPTSAGSASSEKSQPTRGTLWDASIEEPATLGQEADALTPAQTASLGEIMEETRKTVEKNTPPDAGSVQAASPEASVPPVAATIDASIPAATPHPSAPDASAPATAIQPKDSAKPFSLPVVVKTIQFGPKAGQTEIDFNQSKKAWEEAGWKISSIIDMSTRTKTVVLTHADGRVIKFPETTAVNPGQAELPVQVGR